MRVRYINDLLFVNILVALLIIIITFLPSNVLRIVLGLPFVLFFPGYTLMVALFPKKNALEGIERMALSFGLSIAVVPLIGLILNYTPWGIRLYPIVISFSIFILVTSIVAWYRQQRLADIERFTISFNMGAVNWMGQRLVEKIMFGIIIVAIVGAIGAVGYAITTPEVGKSLTEFYILGPEGGAGDYPKEAIVGKETYVIAGIVNRESKMVNYQVEVIIDGVKNNEIGPIILAHEEKWEEEVSFTPVKTGKRQKVEFVLYVEGEAYRQLHLWLDVPY